MSKMRFFALQELSNRKPLEVTTPSNKLSDYYASHVFDRKKMQEYLPKEAYKAVVDATEKGTPISREMADLIANGMKSWAKSLNVTHYTHWFQPLITTATALTLRCRKHPMRVLCRNTYRTQTFFSFLEIQTPKRMRHVP